MTGKAGAEVLYLFKRVVTVAWAWATGLDKVVAAHMALTAGELQGIIVQRPRIVMAGGAVTSPGRIIAVVIRCLMAAETGHLNSIGNPIVDHSLVGRVMTYGTFTAPN